MALRSETASPNPKRLNTEMDPASPDHPISLRLLFSEFLDPIKEEILSIKQYIDETNSKLEDIASMQKDIRELKSDCNDIKGRVADVETTLGKNIGMIKKSVEPVKSLAQENALAVSNIMKENKKLKEDLLHSETYSRRDNLHFCGIPEQRAEDCEHIILKICHDAGMQYMDVRSFVRVHRVGQYNRNRSRPIVARFSHFKDRENIWQCRKDIKQHQGVLIVEDYPSEILARRKQLYPILEAAYNYRDPGNQEFRFKGFIDVDKLILNGSVYTVDTLYKLPPALQPETVASPYNDKIQLFFTRASPLSNHFSCCFTVNGTIYNCMEQYLMKAKAAKFEDTDIGQKIMLSSDPVQHKILGRKVANFDLDAWREAAPEVLKKGLQAKFSQNELCKHFLLATGQREIGEANPNDSFFGIGMGLRQNEAWDKSKWGKNLLGKCLMEVRKELL